MEKKKKNVFEAPEMELVKFTDDVVTGSGSIGGGGGCNEVCEIECTPKKY